MFDYSKADFTGLCDHLLDIDFSNCLQSNAVEHVWSSIKYVILKAMDIYIPKVRLKTSKRPRWFTPEIKTVFELYEESASIIQLHLITLSY